MTLLAPLFLLGVLAVGLPLWLHRLSSENPNRQQFSSAMFLEPGEPRRVLAQKLRYLLLLALRIGVLVLLSLTFARPALQGAAQALVEEGARLHVVVMDVSTGPGISSLTLILSCHTSWANTWVSIQTPALEMQ